MNNGQLIIALMVAIVAIQLFSIIRGVRKHRVKYEIKKFIKALSSLVIVLGISYQMLLVAMIFPHIADWSLDRASMVDINNTFAVFLYKSLPVVFMMSAMVISGLNSIKLANKLTWKFNEQEKQWDRESTERFRNKLPPFMRKFIKVN